MNHDSCTETGITSCIFGVLQMITDWAAYRSLPNFWTATFW